MNHLKIRIVTFCNISNSGKDFFHRHQYVTNHNVSEADFFSSSGKRDYRWVEACGFRHAVTAFKYWRQWKSPS